MNTILWSLAVTWEPMLFIGLPVLILLSLLIFMVKRYRRCPSNRVLVVYGKVGGAKTARCIHGGGVMVWPVIQDYVYMSLEPITITRQSSLRLTTACKMLACMPTLICKVAAGSRQERPVTAIAAR